jgi:precorrin-8X/cobalt-precorrin-8 methylmutase
VAECDRGGLDADEIRTTYLRTRDDCHQWLRQRLIDHVARGRRVLVGFDFPFGYPTGFAAALGLGSAASQKPSGQAGAHHHGPAPWRLIWDELDLLIEDAPDNSNNRFEVAAALNRCCARDGRHDQHRTLDPGSPVTSPGPLWGCPRAAAGQWIQPTSPHYPYRARGLSLARLRWAEQRVPGTQPTWKLMGIGSVGSQCLLGIPVVSRLRSDPQLRDVSSVWPFETCLTDSPAREGGAFVLHAEIWPGIVRVRSTAGGHETAARWGSARKEQPEMIKDEAQVCAVVHWLRSADRSGGLGMLLAAPTRLPPDAHHDVVAEEGWILGGK